MCGLQLKRKKFNDMERKKLEEKLTKFITLADNKISRMMVKNYGQYFVERASKYAESVYKENTLFIPHNFYLKLCSMDREERQDEIREYIRCMIKESVELAYLKGSEDGRKNPDKGPVAKGIYDESRELMLTFMYGDNDSAEDVREAAQKYADIYNEASLSHDTEKLDKLETISEFSNILKKEFADIVKEQYNSDDIGYIDFDNPSNYTKGSIEHTIEELFTKYKSIQEKDVIPSLSNFWCNGEMCIVRILYGYAEVFIA